MNRFIFIPGKNPNLSLAELVSWLDSRSLNFRITETGSGFIVLESDKAPEADQLGGMIKVCSLSESFDRNISHEPEKIFSQPANLSTSKIFGLSVYPDLKQNNPFSKILASSLKKNMRGAGTNAKFMPVPQGRSALTHVEVIKKNLTEFVACIGKEKIHVGKTISLHNPFEFQKRDMKRPQQRPMYSIPPRLARIMINLSQTKAEGRRTLLDPFCGIGTILQEAILMGFEILGTDIDGKCVQQAIQNLEWLSKEYNLQLGRLEEKIQQGDATTLSKNFAPESTDAIVTEPNLGPALKIPPDKNRAERILKGLKPLYAKSLKEFSAILKPKGRMCMVFPRFEFGEHFAHMEAEKMAAKAGLKPVNILGKHNIPGSFPYIDKEERHRTIREIWVFEKPAASN